MSGNTAGRLIWGVLFIAGLIAFALRKPVRSGDGLEYWATLQAWSDHGTPDIRPRDLERLTGLIEAGRVDAAIGVASIPLERTAGGAGHGWHFWMYPLLAVPAKGILRLVGGNELAALQVTNFVLFALTLYGLLFTGKVDRRWRWWFAALVAVGPVLWYLPWPHPEVYTWAAVCIALLLLREKRYGVAAFAASMGALHNPAVTCLVALVVGYAAVRGDRRQIGAALLGASASLIAPLFYLVSYGEPSLLYRVGAVDVRLVSLARVGSLLLDLNQGLLPHAPGLLALGAVALVRLARRRSWQALAMVATALAMAAVCAAAPNWNCGNAGLLRYAVWILPLLAWVIVELPPPRRWAVGTLGAAVAVHAAIVLAGSSAERSLAHAPVAAYVLRHAPALYSPVPEIFAERQLQREQPFRSKLPLGFTLASGEVTKLLLDACSLAWLPLRFRVDPAYLEAVHRSHGRRRGLFYLEPPRGTVRRRTAPLLPEQVATTFLSSCSGDEAPYAADQAFLTALQARLPPSALVFEWPGAPEAPLQATLIAREPDQVVETLALAGFSGLCVDRSRYPDGAAALMARLTAALPDNAPVLSTTGRWVLFDLDTAFAVLARRYPGRALEMRREAALSPLALTWGPGFHRPETEPGTGIGYRWAEPTATLTIANGLPRSRTVVLDAAFITATSRPAHLRIEGDLLAETLAISRARTLMSRRLQVPPGRHTLRFTSDGLPLNPPDDPRLLVWRLEDLRLREENPSGLD
jgi:hypothetical protein